MTPKYILNVAFAATAVLVASTPAPIQAQGKAASAKSLRCTFSLMATATWNKDGAPEAAVKPSKLVLRFDSINTDEGTAQLRNGTVGTGLTVQLSNGNLHFTQSFRTGPLYLTTVFDKETSAGKLKAVHSRHEYFTVPLEGATSSPEQYLGECEVVN